MALINLAELTWNEGDNDQTHPLLTEALTIVRDLGMQPFIPHALRYLGYVARARNLPEEARACFGESAEREQQRDSPIGMVRSLVGLAQLAADAGQRPAAVRWLGAIQERVDADAGILWVPKQQARAHVLAAAQAQLAEATFVSTWATGQSLA